MAKQKVRATRHNGRKGENGVFKAGHNDRSFDVDAAEHIDPSRSFMNVYWDMYQGYNIASADGVRPERRFSFEEIEKAFYCSHFGDSLDAQTERHIKSRHKDRIRTMDQIREDPKTCPEETVYQLGTKDGHEDPALFVQVVAELVEEFTKRFGSHVQVLDWALHMDEATPHIHERHVFFADDGYGMYFPKQEKACEALGFERPNLEKKSNKFNNAKMVFDEEVRKLYIEIAEKYGVVIEKIPLEGKKHLEKNDYILAKQAEEIANNEARLQSLELKIEDVETFSEEIATGLARKVEQLLQTIKLEAYSEPLPLQTDRIHVANGTLFLNGEFSAQKDFCLNRLPVIYNSDAEKPVRWLKFMEELLNPDDILTLQEYMGYMLLPTTKAQKMMLIIGKGGEGKSRIGLVLRELFGNNMYSCSLQKIEVDKFARANLEYMLITVDDDMKLEALPQTNHIKSIVTLEDQIDLERKGQQSFQGVVYARLIAFGNGGLHALYDKTDGFYRRQLILTTKDKVDGREDDPYLIDKLRKERDGIFIWALEGLCRLVSNNYVFTESVDAKQNLVDAQEEGNNILAFMKSEGYLQFETGKKISSTDFYNIYVSWCEDNLEKPRASAGFLHYIKENQKRYGLIYDAKCIGNCRGFHNVCKSEFSPVIGKTPFD